MFVFWLGALGGSLSFAGFKPIDDLSFPEGATHVSLRFLSCDVAFADDLVVVESSATQNLLLDGTNTPFSLNVAMNASIGTRFFILFVEFFQQVNGVQYSLRNGAFNVLNVLSVV